MTKQERLSLVSRIVEIFEEFTGQEINGEAYYSLEDRLLELVKTIK